MTDIGEVERAVAATNDKTLEARQKQRDYIMGRLAETPRPTYRQLGKEMGLHFQHIGRVVKRGEVRPSGRPRSNEGRIKRLNDRLNRWDARRTNKLAKGLDVAFEDRNIEKLHQQLADLG